MNKLLASVFFWVVACWVTPCIVMGQEVTAPDPPLTEAPQDFKDFDLGKYAIKPVAPEKDATTGFLVGGKNTTSLVKKLTEINGQTIAELEHVMRPGAASTAGFLGADESLLDVLSHDNACVVDELGLTHQELAKHLHAMGAIGDWQFVNGQEQAEFRYYGRRFKVTLLRTRGFQGSPFNDGTISGTDAVVANLDNGKSLRYGLLVPAIVEHYGFYEGRGTTYRLEPSDVVAVFDFLKPMEKGKGEEGMARQRRSCFFLLPPRF
jgi:hypothetical protein